MSLVLMPVPSFTGQVVQGSDGHHYQVEALFPTRVCRTADQEVSTANSPPQPDGTAPSDASIQEGEAIIPMDFSSCFSDLDGDTLTYAFAAPLIAGLTIDPATGMVTGTPTEGPGTYTVNVVANDGTNTSTPCTTALTINAASGGNTPPLTNGTPPPPQTIQAGSSLTPMDFSGCFSDVDGDALTYTLTGSFPTGITIDTSTGIVSGTPTTAGSYSISVVANDGTANSSPCTAQLTVTAATGNNPPTADGTAPNSQSVAQGTAISPMDFSGCFNDLDGDALTYTLTPAVAGLTINPSTGIVTGTPTGAPGSYNVNVVASDGTATSPPCTSVVTVTSAASPITGTAIVTPNTSQSDPSPEGVASPPFIQLLDTATSAATTVAALRKRLTVGVQQISGGDGGPYTVDFSGVTYSVDNGGLPPNISSVDLQFEKDGAVAGPSIPGQSPTGTATGAVLSGVNNAGHMFMFGNWASYPTAGEFAAAGEYPVAHIVGGTIVVSDSSGNSQNFPVPTGAEGIPGGAGNWSDLWRFTDDSGGGGGGGGGLTP